MDTLLERSDCSKKKVCFFIGNMSRSGGTERVLSVIANGLSERGFSVFIMSLWGDGKSFFSLKDEIKLYWIEQGFKGTGITGIIGRLRYLNGILRKEKAEILVDVDIILGCYSFFLKKWMPELRWVSWEHFNYYHHFKKNHFLRKIIKRAAGRYSDQIVVLTEEDRTSYEKHLKPRCGIRCIYNPVPYEGTFAKEDEKARILAAGRLTGEKGFESLIHSWRRLEDAYPEWEVVVAGEGEDRKKLEKAIRVSGLKRLYLAGNVPDIERYYQEAAFFVLPSKSEGFGMVLVEAMCFSNPVVSYACGAGPKKIVLDGKNGFLVEPGNVEQFAGRMEALMSDAQLRKKMGNTARKSVVRFEKEKILGQWERLLNRMDSV